MADTTMDLTGHTPKFGRRPEAGEYLAEVSNQTYNDDANKGHAIRFQFRICDGSTQDGCTVGSTFYILNDQFTGSDGHRDVTLDSWFHLLKAVGMKPGKFDAKKVAERLIGRRLGIKVVESDQTDKNGQPYMNVDAFFPAEALATAAPDPVEDDDTVDEAVDTEEVDLADIS